MKIKPINEINICEQVRYNESVTGTHLSVRSGTPNQDKKDFALCSLVSMMVQRGLIVKKPNETTKKCMSKAIKDANNLVDNFALEDGMRM